MLKSKKVFKNFFTIVISEIGEIPIKIVRTKESGIVRTKEALAVIFLL